MTVGPAMEANDNPTNCAVLDEGESEEGGGTGAARSDTQYLIRWTELSMLLNGVRAVSQSPKKYVKHRTYLIYVEYILMNAAWERKQFPTVLATFIDIAPSLSASATTSDGCMTGVADFSSAGKKLSLWKEKRASRPLNTILRSIGGTTVSLLPPVKAFTGADAGLM